MLDLFWDLYQQNSISELQSEVHNLQSQRADSTSSHLEERLERMTLIMMAMWSLLVEKTPLTEEDLIERVKEIDLSDGKLDGRIRQQVANCPQCKRVLSRKHKRCLYCGFSLTSGQSAFDQVLE